MENLLEKLQSLKGTTIDDEMIARLLSEASVSVRPADRPESESVGFDDICRNGTDHVDDILIASRAAELEMESMRRYFPRANQTKRMGIDGLQDEDLSSDSEDEVDEINTTECSILDKLLADNSMVTVKDDEDDLVASEELAGNEVDMSHIPSSLVVPYGSQFIPLGKILSIVDGLLVIGELNPVQLEGENQQATNPVACDVESMVFLSGSDPLEVVGMIVDTLGTVQHPMHLVLVSNKDMIKRLIESNELLGASVCTLSSHSKIVEIDAIGGHLAIRGSPQLAELEDYDDDGAEDEDGRPLQVTPPPQYRNNIPYSYRR
jgi:hypothetical protein